MTTAELLLRLALGAALGGAIGLERQVHGRPAGFRTHMLVCLASVLIMEVSEYFHLLSKYDPSYVRVDPGRIAAGAITGVGFLGAGVIVKTGATVQGLTTAACLWVVSAMGLALGAGMYAAAGASFVLTMFSLVVLRLVEARTPRLVFKTLSVTGGDGFDEAAVMEVLGRYRARVQTTDYEVDAAGAERTCRLTLALDGETPQGELAAAVAALAGVRRVSLRS